MKMNLFKTSAALSVCALMALSGCASSEAGNNGENTENEQENTEQSEEMTDEEKALIEKTAEMTAKFEAAMEDDFNTADAIAAVFELVKFANSNSSAGNTAEYLNALKAKITALTDVLGLITEKEAEMLDEEIENLIAQRQQARKDRDFAKADEIRDTLLAKGIVLEDTREGVRWKRA